MLIELKLLIVATKDLMDFKNALISNIQDRFKWGDLSWLSLLILERNFSKEYCFGSRRSKLVKIGRLEGIIFSGTLCGRQDCRYIIFV